MIAFTVGELAVAGSFYLAPLAIGSLVASLAAFAGVPVAGEWALFLGGSAATFAAMRPLARRLESKAPHTSVGAHRWVSREALVTQDIPGHPGGGGQVRLDREQWRAGGPPRAPLPGRSPVPLRRVAGPRPAGVPIHPPAERPHQGEAEGG